MNCNRIAGSVLVVLSVVGVANADGEPLNFLGFEDLTLGDTYVHLDSFVTSGVKVTVDTFLFSNGNPFNGGFTKVENLGLAGGTGNELEVNNVNLAFGFEPLTSLNFFYGEYGGNINIEINGDFRNVDNFADLVSPIGGVFVFALDFGTPGNGIGELSLGGGTINSLAIGGQELWIDAFKGKIVPEPATVLLLVLGGLGLLRRRTR